LINAANLKEEGFSVMEARPLKMDIYRVPNAGPKPAIFFVPGGSYVRGDRGTT
jgi:acetyl esterase/lipase